jgi:hypothetical protein
MPDRTGSPASCAAPARLDWLTATVAAHPAATLLILWLQRRPVVGAPGAGAKESPSPLDNNVIFILAVLLSSAVLTLLIVGPGRRIWEKFRPVVADVPNWVSAPPPFPRRELTALIVTSFEAAELAANGKKNEGLEALKAGMQQAAGQRAEGEPLGDEMTELWTEATRRFASRYSLQDGSGEVVEIRHRKSGQVMQRVERGTLAGADLRRANLAEADLRGLNLDGVSLTGANLMDADLAAAVLTNTFMAEAMLDNANMAGADCHRANMRAANLRGADLSFANLRAANLTGADLEFAKLTGADLTGATLYSARYNNRTEWPDGFDPQKSGAIRN